MKNKISKQVEELSKICLEYSGVHRNYSDEDLSNAMLILMEILLAKTHDKHRSKLNNEQLLTLVEELGKSMHQTVLLFSGVDLHKIYE